MMIRTVHITLSCLTNSASAKRIVSLIVQTPSCAGRPAFLLRSPRRCPRVTLPPNQRRSHSSTSDISAGRHASKSCRGFGGPRGRTHHPLDQEVCCCLGRRVSWVLVGFGRRHHHASHWPLRLWSGVGACGGGEARGSRVAEPLVIVVVSPTGLPVRACASDGSRSVSTRRSYSAAAFLFAPPSLLMHEFSTKCALCLALVSARRMVIASPPHACPCASPRTRQRLRPRRMA